MTYCCQSVTVLYKLIILIRHVVKDKRWDTFLFFMLFPTVNDNIVLNYIYGYEIIGVATTTVTSAVGVQTYAGAPRTLGKWNRFTAVE